MLKIKKALLSVSDKTGLLPFAQSLISFGVEIISTGGTYQYLQQNRIPVKAIWDVTGFPEILDGRVKTLHPAVHGGLLARRDNDEHMKQLREQSIDTIDLVAINLYPFEKTIANPAATLDEAIEQIDIGGPSILRSASKNFHFVTAICDPDDYNVVINEIKEHGGCVSDEVRFQLARKVFETTSKYDAAINNYFSGIASQESSFPQTFSIHSKKVIDLRYGENPHQAAALYGNFESYFEKIHGKELSYNNIVDIQACTELIEEFQEPAAAIVKHTNPCGCAIRNNIFDAYVSALSTDPISAFGGIVSFNREVGNDLAEEVNKIFTEVIIASNFTEDALSLLRKKKERRLIVQKKPLQKNDWNMKSVAGGFLIQTKDNIGQQPGQFHVVTKRSPTNEELSALSFAWRVAKHVKSNAIVYTNTFHTLGIGAGQMSRVDSSIIAIRKAQAAGHSLVGSVVASDAFFPFADGLLEAVKAGATAVIQPGGSVRDAEVIQAADDHNIAMIFTGIRHFKH